MHQATKGRPTRKQSGWWRASSVIKIVLSRAIGVDDRASCDKDRCPPVVPPSCFAYAIKKSRAMLVLLKGHSLNLLCEEGNPAAKTALRPFVNQMALRPFVNQTALRPFVNRLTVVRGCVLDATLPWGCSIRLGVAASALGLQHPLWGCSILLGVAASTLGLQHPPCGCSIHLDCWRLGVHIPVGSNLYV